MKHIHSSSSSGLGPGQVLLASCPLSSSEEDLVTLQNKTHFSHLNLRSQKPMRSSSVLGLVHSQYAYLQVEKTELLY